jgi:hypothetical protein
MLLLMMIIDVDVDVKGQLLLNVVILFLNDDEFVSALFIVSFPACCLRLVND